MKRRQRRSSSTTRHRARNGATITEFILVVSAFLMLLFGTLDLGIAVFRRHIISNVARTAARMASVRGSLGTSLGTWGPTAIDTTMDAVGSPLVDALSPSIVGANPAQTRVTVTWPNGNDPGDSVVVTVTSIYSPISLFFLPSGNVTLSATSTMVVAH